MIKRFDLIQTKHLIIVVTFYLFGFLLFLKTAFFSEAVFLLFFLTIMHMTFRLRFPSHQRWLWIDILIYLIIGILYPEMLVYSAIFLFYLGSKGLYKQASTLIVIVVLLNSVNGYEWLLFIQVILFSAFIFLFDQRYLKNIVLEDRLRKQIYDLETIQTKLLKDYMEAEHFAALKERQRIAEKLHDELGHELTGVHLAMKAYHYLLTKDPEKAKVSFEQMNQRLSQALFKLKETVHNTEPLEEYGYQYFKRQIDGFKEYPVELSTYGNLIELPSFIWQIINSTTKEALTNILKHAKPNFVKITLESTATIVRLAIENDGISSNVKTHGVGLSYMRKRIEALSGSLSIQKKESFILVAIIPIRRLT